MNKNKNKIKIFVFLFIPLLAGFFILEKCRAEEDDIIINEILIGGDDTKEEFIEIYNTTPKDIDLKSLPLKLHIVSSKEKDTTKNLDFKNSTVSSHEYFLIASSDFHEKYKNIKVDATYSTSSNSLVPDGAVYISMTQDNLKSIIDYVAFGNNDYFKKSAFANPKKTQSMERKKIDKNDWQISYSINGTPGEKNSEKSEQKDYSDKVKINEIFPTPKIKNNGKEFVEIINLFNEPVNLSGMRIEDEKNHKVFFPDKIIAPKELFYLEGNFKLNNTTSDTAFLIDKNETKENPIDSVNYTNPKYDYSYAFNGSTWKWTSKITPGEKNEFDKTVSGKSIRIVRFSPNPKGSDTKNEWIEIKNRSKKKANLKNWSIATGWDNLYNHPIREDFKIKPGKTKKLTRKICAFTLNNKKTKIELRDPSGKVAQKIKYDRSKNKIEEDEIYEKNESGWEWNMENVNQNENIAEIDLKPAPVEIPTENTSENMFNITSEEIQSSVGKYTLNSAWQEKQKYKIVLASTSVSGKIKLPEKISGSPAQVFGAEKIKTQGNFYVFTSIIPQKHWAAELIENSWEKINSWLNRILNER